MSTNTSLTNDEHVIPPSRNITTAPKTWWNRMFGKSKLPTVVTCNNKDKNEPTAQKKPTSYSSEDLKRQNHIDQQRLTVQQLKGVRDMLQRKCQEMDDRIEKEIETCKVWHARGNRKDKVMMCLRRKRDLTLQLQRMQNQTDNVIRQIDAAEMGVIAQHMVDAYDGMRVGLRQGVDIHSIDNVMEDIQENIDSVNEINNALSTPLHTIGTADVDFSAENDEELYREFQASMELDLINPPAFTQEKIPPIPTTTASANPNHPKITTTPTLPAKSILTPNVRVEKISFPTLGPTTPKTKSASLAFAE